MSVGGMGMMMFTKGAICLWATLLFISGTVVKAANEAPPINQPTTTLAGTLGSSNGSSGTQPAQAAVSIINQALNHGPDPVLVQSDQNQAEIENLKTKNLFLEEKNRTLTEHIATNTEKEIAEAEVRAIDASSKSGAIHLSIDLSLIPDPPLASLPYKFVSVPGPFRAETERLYQDLFKIEPKFTKQRNARDLGLFAIEEADLMFSSGDSEDAEFWKDLGAELLEVAVGLNPTTGLVQSFYELTIGRNFITGATLSSFERTFAFLGVVTLGGSKALITVNRISGNLIRVASRVPTLFNEVKAIEVAIQEGIVVVERAPSNFSSLKKTIALLKEYNIKSDYRRVILESFTGETQVIRAASEEKIGYRYWKEGYSYPRGHWLTEALVENPQAELALGTEGAFQVKKWVIPAGSDRIEGLVAPKFGQPGGMRQMFIPNKEILQ